MRDNTQFLNDMFSAFRNTAEYKDRSMLDIVARKTAFEENLDDMWAIYTSGNPKQIIEYNKGLNQIKETGLKVYRNSNGKHKIVIPK